MACKHCTEKNHLHTHTHTQSHQQCDATYPEWSDQADPQRQSRAQLGSLSWQWGGKGGLCWGGGDSVQGTGAFYNHDDR